MLRKTEGRRRRGWMTKDEMVVWYHQLNGHEFEQAPRRTGKPWMLHAVHGVSKCQTQLSDKTTTKLNAYSLLL